ncbi:MAG: DUF6774 domain-containing protein [Lachnospiraceae bacterium]|nr:hypothetical protein [Robinsoniella sp.]MDY3765371.1 DUF6774 domain-containing protein [Lachnospiraceae bacterium]
MNSCELVTLVSTLAYNIAQCHTPEEIALLSAIFLQLGDSLETILAHSELCKKDVE